LEAVEDLLMPVLNRYDECTVARQVCFKENMSLMQNKKAGERIFAE